MALAILMPKLGLTMTEGLVIEWHKKEGDEVTKGEIICTISSEKLTSDLTAEEDGVLSKILVGEGDTAACKAVIGYIGEEGESIAESGAAQSLDKVDSEQKSAPSQPVIKNDFKPESSKKRLFISKLAKKIALDKGVDYTQVEGTGGNGRITKRDVERFMANNPVTVSKGGAANFVSHSASNIESLTGMRKIIAKNMMHSLGSTAQFTIHRKVDVTSLMFFREEMKQKLEKLDQSSLSLNVLLIKAVALTLKEIPQMNAHFSAAGYQQLNDINIGVAVALKDGLVVPVIEDVAFKSLRALTQEFKDVVSDAKSGVFDAAKKGTFTITNLGSENVEYFTPILNVPEVAILGIGALAEKIYLTDEDSIAVAKELPLSLTVDHQVVDGELAAKFLQKLAEYLGEPYSLIL